MKGTDFIEKIERRSKYLGKLNLPALRLFDGPKMYIHTLNLFYATFETIPSKILMHHSKVDKLITKVEKEFESKIISKHYLRYGVQRDRKLNYAHIVYLLENEIMLDVELTGEVGILFSQESEEEALRIEEMLKERIKKQKESRIHMLSSNGYGNDLTPLLVKKPKMDMSMHYNDDMKEFHEFIMQKVRNKNESGLIMLHGDPGTGKTTYIRYLINCIKKKIIFLPPAVAGSLDSPSFTNLLTENPNSIFVIEDAEQLIKSREIVQDSHISMLLNLTDGVLGESLGSIFICTFNTDLKNIDEALLRKGRLIASYKFGELSIEKLTRLKEYLGIPDLDIHEGMGLSDIYHAHKNEFGNDQAKKSTIGF